MKNTAVLTIKKEAVLTFIALLGVAVAAPLIKQQYVTGTIVNATLIIGTACLGVRYGLLLCLLPSSIALATGLLNPVLAPMVPFIVMGNVVLVLAFRYLKNSNFWVGAAAGAVLKFALLQGMSTVVIGLLINKSVAPAVANMMSWPQLITALAGGVVAFGTIKLLKHRRPA